MGATVSNQYVVYTCRAKYSDGSSSHSLVRPGRPSS